MANIQCKFWKISINSDSTKGSLRVARKYSFSEKKFTEHGQR